MGVALQRGLLRAARPALLRLALARCAADAGAADDAETDDASDLTRQMLAIGAPALLGLMIDPLASMADSAFIGRMCGPVSLAGTGVAVSLVNLLSKTFNFLSSATTSMIASATSGAEVLLS